MAETILRTADVLDITGLPRSTMYLMVKNGIFPKPIKLSPRNVGWLRSEIDAWIQSRIEARG